MLKQMLEYSTLMMVPKDRLYVVAKVVTNSTRLRQNKLDMTLFDTISKVQILVKTVLFFIFLEIEMSVPQFISFIPKHVQTSHYNFFFIDTFFSIFLIGITCKSISIEYILSIFYL